MTCQRILLQNECTLIKSSCAIVQALRCHLLIVEGRVQSVSISCGTYVEKMTVGQVSLQMGLFSPFNRHRPNTPQSSISASKMCGMDDQPAYYSCGSE
jgi:hypothetical protein